MSYLPYYWKQSHLSPALLPHTHLLGPACTYKHLIFGKNSKHAQYLNNWISLQTANLSCRQPLENIHQGCRPGAVCRYRHPVHLFWELWVWAAVHGTSRRISRGNITNSPSIHTKSFVFSFTAITISNQLAFGHWKLYSQLAKSKIFSWLYACKLGGIGGLWECI